MREDVYNDHVPAVANLQMAAESMAIAPTCITDSKSVTASAKTTLTVSCAPRISQGLGQRDSTWCAKVAQRRDLPGRLVRTAMQLHLAVSGTVTALFLGNAHTHCCPISLTAASRCVTL
jgi:hypothetical protein